MIPELMMHIESMVPELKEKIEPNVIPDGLSSPFCRYFTYDGEDIQTMGPSIGESVKIQFDIFADSFSELKTLKKEVKKALYSFECYPHHLKFKDDYEESTKLHRQILTFEIKF